MTTEARGAIPYRTFYTTLLQPLTPDPIQNRYLKSEFEASSATALNAALKVVADTRADTMHCYFTP